MDHLSKIQLWVTAVAIALLTLFYNPTSKAATRVKSEVEIQPYIFVIIYNSAIYSASSMQYRTQEFTSAQRCTEHLERVKAALYLNQIKMLECTPK